MADVALRLQFDDDNVLRGLREIETRFDKLEREVKEYGRAHNKAFSSARRDTVQLNKSLKSNQSFLSGSVKSLSSLAAVGGAAFTALAVGAGAVVASGAKMAIGYEQTQVAFETFLGSAEAATATLEKLEKFSTKTPFTPDQVNEAGKALLAFGITTDELIPSLKAVGDISAGTGKDFNELAVIYGKARTAGTLFAEDINQLTEAGIPIIDQFAKQLGVLPAEVKKLSSEGKIGFKDLEQAFADMTGEGGQFFDLMDKQSQTVGGRISTLQGNFGKLQRELGEKFLPVISEVVDNLNTFVQALDLDAVFEFFKPVQDELVPALETMFDAISEVVDALFGFTDETDKSAAASSFLSDAFDLLVKSLTFVVNLVTISIKHFKNLYDNFLPLRLVIDGVRNAIGLLAKGLEYIFDTVNEWVNGTKETTTAIKLQNQALSDAQKNVLDKADADLEAATATGKHGDEVTTATAKQKELTKEQKAAIKELERMTAAYDKLNAKISNQVDDTYIDSLTGIDKLVAEKEQTLREVENLKIEIEKAAAAIGKDVPQEVYDNIAGIVNNVEAEFRNEVDKIREKEGFTAVDLLPTIDELEGKKAGEKLAADYSEGLEGYLEGRDLFSALKDELGLLFGVNEEELEFMFTQVSNLANSIGQAWKANIDSQIADQDRLIESYDEQTDALNTSIDKQLDLQQKGLANNLDLERKKLKTIQQEREKAEKKKQQLANKAEKAQIASDALKQSSSIAVAGAQLMAAHSNIPFVGIGIAVGLIATMVAAITKLKAQSTRLYTGGSVADVIGGGGFVNRRSGRSDKHGTGHKVADSNLILGGREFVLNEDLSLSNEPFLIEWNKGLYGDLDMREIAQNAINAKKINKRFKKRDQKIIQNQIIIQEQQTKAAIEQQTSELINYFENRPQYIPLNDDTKGYILKSKGLSRKVEFE